MVATSVVWLSSACLGLVSTVSSSTLPIVNLGYGRHQASFYEEDGSYYNFSNIRYGAPPLGDGRFRAPQPPQNYTGVDDGSIGRVCPQGPTPWIAITYDFLNYYEAGQPFNFSAAEAVANLLYENATTTVDPRVTEDCLFLDVYTPRKVLQKVGTGQKGAPVLVWITGGGYIQGDKNNNGQWNPKDLIKISQGSGGDGLIVVSLNYRLGAFGFLGGPTFQQDGTANVGFHDQRLALQWIQDKIHLFDGDKARVTVFGESAGGGSIIHHITAYGGLQGPAPFAQAIPQSPAWINVPGNVQQEDIVQAFLRQLNVTSIQEARHLPSAVLIKANAEVVAASPYGRYTFGPGVDGSFVPALPAQMLLHGQFDKTVKVMPGYNSNEGFLFTDPRVDSNAAFENYVRAVFPDVTDSALDYITGVLYPAVFDGSQPYRTQFDRASLFGAEYGIACNAYYLDTAFGNQTYGYQFAVYPGIHGQDLNYTFYHGPNPTVTSPGVAAAMQEYITNFAVTGAPGKAGGANSTLPEFPVYGEGAQIIRFLNGSSISVIKDPVANARCDWWQKALYY